ncbi:transcriptional regulator [Psychrobacter sp. T6-6]|uniref:transcriptional regulator n=1 Tax=Psychrobacter sp. T6-6 TaxID=3457452 RepID=UPI003FCEFFE5
MTIEKLEQGGRLLYGDQWQANLARDFDIDSRRIRQWLSGDRPISDWVKGDLIKLLKANQKEISEYLADIT